MNRTFRSLHVRNYRLFATGQLISLTGTWMQMIAQDWLVVSKLGGHGVALGTVTALQFLPMMLIGMWGGILADRYPKRRILLCTATMAGLLAAVLGVLVATDLVRLWMVFVLALLLGTVNAIDMPSRQSFTVEMVGSEDLINAVALNSATFNGARILGPAVAGVIISVAGFAPVFALNAASYVAVVIGLLRMRTSELTPATRLVRGRGQLREALRYVAGRRELLLPVLLVGTLGMFAFNSQITLALMAKDVFGRDAGTYGALSAMLALGALGGALLGARRTRPRIAVMLGAALAFGASEIVVGLAPTLPVFALLLVPTGALMITFASTANSLVQLSAGEEIRGRVMALYSLVFLGGTPIGAPVIGWLAEHFGARSGLILGGGVSVLLTVVIAGALLSGESREALRHPRSVLRELRTGLSPTPEALR